MINKRGILAISYRRYTDIYPCLLSLNTKEGEAKYRITFFRYQEGSYWTTKEGKTWSPPYLLVMGHIPLNERELNTGIIVMKRIVRAFNYNPFIGILDFKLEQFKLIWK